MNREIQYQSDTIKDTTQDLELQESSSDDEGDSFLTEQENDPVLRKLAQTGQANFAAATLLDELEKETLNDNDSRSLRSRQRNRNTSGKNSKKRKPSTRNSRKMERTDNITGEPSQEFIKKRKNTWKVQKILRNKAREGESILDNAKDLDTCIIESLVYYKHTFGLSYDHGSYRGESFQKELMERWIQSSPNKTIRYLNKKDKISTYNLDDSWEDMSWNQPTAWILDTANLLEDDTLWVLRMIDEINIQPYVKLIDSIKFI